MLELAGEVGFGGLTMEAIAARAGAGKQTLYRSWTNPGAILFDALLDRDRGDAGDALVPDTGDLRADLVALASGIVAELSDPASDRLLRAATAQVLTDPDLNLELLHRLLEPQMRAIGERWRIADVDAPDELAELLVGPIFHRWLLRTRAFDDAWLGRHVDRVLAAATR
ncbi:TetR/AcrR family transcriptional regulator [Serinibacter arcticus]|uniref:TetR/AcrR family transcriptional regulator n=1 Tax=Serinibacter arcticus TaxID=1655435 RepID=UPI001F361DDD|nr:TetR/AcrR family transcriptional regulator [Serinibacter arcticus]